MTARAGALLAALVACGGCDDRGSSTPRAPDQPARRVIEPPHRDVRALPPHVIAAGGVGPYKLGVAMERVLSALPSGPRLTVLQIPSVLDVRIGRDDGLIVGGERQGPASFVAVLREGFARTADGTGVGARKDAVVTALGPAARSPQVARDPELWVGSKLPNARFVFDGDRVAAVLLSTDAAPADERARPRCGPRSDDAWEGAVPGAPVFAPACLGQADGYAVVGEQLVIAASEQDDRPARKIAGAQVPGLRWAAPLRADGDRDDLVAVAEQDRDHARVFTVVALRPDGGKLVPVASLEAYRLTDQGLALIGATVDDVALELEVTGDGDVLTVGGVFIHRSEGRIGVVAPLVPVTVRRTRRSVDERADERGDGREPAPARTDARTPEHGGAHPHDAGEGGSAEPPSETP